MASQRRKPRAQIVSIRAEELEERLLPILRGLVFHVTSRLGYEGIVAEGAILSNRDGRLGNTFPQSASSYGRKRGCVCLFDLRDVSDEHLFGYDRNGTVGALDKFYFLNPGPFANNPFFFVLDEAFHGGLIPWTAGNPPEMRIPYVEAWYLGQIELTKVQKVIDVRVMPRKVVSIAIGLGGHREIKERTRVAKDPRRPRPGPIP